MNTNANSVIAYSRHVIAFYMSTQDQLWYNYVHAEVSMAKGIGPMCSPSYNEVVWEDEEKLSCTPTSKKIPAFVAIPLCPFILNLHFLFGSFFIQSLGRLCNKLLALPLVNCGRFRVRFLCWPLRPPDSSGSVDSMGWHPHFH